MCIARNQLVRPQISSETLTSRFPHAAAAAGHYESIYFTAGHPTEPLAVWVRYTVHKPPGGMATGSIWFTLFEPHGPTAVKVTDTPHSSDDDELLVAVGRHGAVRRDGADGALAGTGGNVSWAVDFEPSDHELRHLPYGWMYRAALPRTKSTSPYPSMKVSGTVTVGDRTIVLDGWAGMLGHNWGAEHAHRWIWLRGTSFTDRPEAWLDVVIGRLKIGPLVLPWIANGAFAPDGPGGARHRIGGIGRRVTVRESRDDCELVLPGSGVTLTVHVSAPLAASVGWQYADPNGGQHQVRNCSIAGLAVDAQFGQRRRGGTERLITGHGGVYELGTAQFDPSVTMQPYTDGPD